MALILRERYKILEPEREVARALIADMEQNAFYAPTEDYEHALVLMPPPNVSERATPAQERIKWPLVLLIALGLDLVGFLLAYAWRWFV